VPITADGIKALVVRGAPTIAVPDLTPPSIDLRIYDTLLTEVAA